MSVDNVVNIIGTFISYLNFALIYNNIVKIKFKLKWFYIPLFILLATLNIILIPKLPIAIKPIYNLICFGLSIKISSKIEIHSLVYYVLTIWIIGSILDILFMAFFAVGFNYILKSLPVFGMAAITLMLQLILNLVFRIKKFNALVIKLEGKLRLVNNITWIFFILIFLIVFFAVTAFTNVGTTNNVIMLLLLLFIAIFLIIFFIKILYEEKTFKITIENLLENNKYYLEVNTQDRIFKHNIIHRLNSIKSTADKKTDKLIDDLIDDYNLSSMPNKSVDMLPNGINGIISRLIYSKNISNLDLAINNYLESDLFNVLTARQYNKLCETLGVCLDNALNATEKSEEKILQVVVLETDENIIIKIINTFRTSIEVDKLGTLNYSTCKNGHGLGLYSLFGRKELKLKTSIINNLFENQITIKKKIKTSNQI